MTTLIFTEPTRERAVRRPDWRRVVALLPRLLWRAQQRRRDRMALLCMSESMLRDIGVSRPEADRAARDISLWR